MEQNFLRLFHAFFQHFDGFQVFQVELGFTEVSLCILYNPITAFIGSQANATIVD